MDKALILVLMIGVLAIPLCVVWAIVLKHLSDGGI